MLELRLLVMNDFFLVSQPLAPTGAAPRKGSIWQLTDQISAAFCNDCNDSSAFNPFGNKASSPITKQQCVIQEHEEK
jgi:hypothetical protein